MNNLKIIAACLVVVFIGLFVFDTVKKKGRKVASSDIGREKTDLVIPKKTQIKIQVVKKGAPMPKFKGNEMALLDKSMFEGGIDISKKGTGEFAKYPIYKGRTVVKVYGGKLIAPTTVPKKILMSKEGEHADLVEKVVRFFSNLGFNQDQKMKVLRGKSFLALRGGDGIKVEAFTVIYNWNKEPRKETWLMRSTNGRMFKKLSQPLVASK